MASLSFVAFSNTWIKLQQYTQWHSQGITALKFVELEPASKEHGTYTHKLLLRPYLSFPLVSTSLSGLRLAVADVQRRFTPDLWCVPTAAPRKRQPGAYKSRAQISQQNIPNRAYRQGHMGIFTNWWTGSTTALQAIKKITMKAWMERGGPSTSHNRVVYTGAVKKGMEQLESMCRGRAGSEITHEEKDCFALSLNRVCHPLSLRVKNTGMAAIMYFLSSVQYKNGSKSEGIWGNFLEPLRKDWI